VAGESLFFEPVDRRRDYLRRAADWLVGDDVEDRKRLGAMVKAEARLSRADRQARDAPHIARYGWRERGQLVMLKSKNREKQDARG
jgi:hypothetical protein